MALSAATVWEARSASGNNNNGGGFVAGSGGTDRSQQDAAQVAIDNATITTSITTNVITFTGGYSPIAGDVGNLVQMLTGTNVTAGFYEITSVVVGTSWTVDRNVVTSGTTTNATGNMGGALGAGAFGKLKGAMVAQNKAYLKGTTFSETATSVFAQSVLAPAAATPATRLIGYGTARGDTGHARLTLATNTGLIGIDSQGSGFRVEQVDVDCASLGTSTGMRFTSNNAVVLSCKVSNFTSFGIQCLGVNSDVFDAEVTGGTSAATYAIQFNSVNNMLQQCYIHDNACVGVYCGGTGTIARNIIETNTGASSDAIRAAASQIVILNNTIHANGRHGIAAQQATNMGNLWRNNLLTSNGGYGIVGSNGTAIPAAPEYDGNAFWNNTSGARNLMDSTAGIYGVNPYTNVWDVTLTADPYVDAANADFDLNTTAGGGAAARAVAIPGAFPGAASTTGYLDMGAVQHQDAGGGGAMKRAGSGGGRVG